MHLGALGAVLRATSLLRSIKRKYPSSHITWVTDSPGHRLLQPNLLIDRVLTTDIDGILQLSGLEFDVGFCIDKSLKAAGVLKQTHVDLLYGFQVDSNTGAILPATEHATELWNIGLDDHQKFFVNKKAETQLMNEALALAPFLRDEYLIQLSEVEEVQTLQRRQQWAHKEQILVGINTGCSEAIPNKKLPISIHRKLIQELILKEYRVVLLGGPEDTERNHQIAQGFDAVIESPTQNGIRDGLVSVNACDLVITGDSLGMHMAIALKKWVVAWFGPTCSHEIDLYQRGVSVHTRASCAPCWKRSCQKQPMCYDLVEIDEIISGVEKGQQWLKSTYSSKQHLSEIYF